VKEAAKRGGVGAILYNDPADSNINITYPIYPDTWWLPGDDVEHGNTRLHSGDPATPGYASTGIKNFFFISPYFVIKSFYFYI
jgi:hypothetical protein